MSSSIAFTPLYTNATLPFKGMQAVYVQAMFISSAILLPIMAHTLHAPVRYLLPMHWPVLLAGLLYGWRAGAITGVLVPLASYVVSGFPLPGILPSMTAELFIYGFAAGMLRQKFNFNPFLSIAVAIIIGRLIFIISVLITNKASISDTEYFTAALMPGIVAAFLQIFSLPLLSQWLVQRNYKRGKN